MQTFRSVHATFWTGKTGKQIRQLGPKYQMLALYVVTSPHANMIGLYHLPLAYVCADTGLRLDEVPAVFRELAKLGFLQYDESTETVWVCQAVVYQVGDNIKRKLGARVLFTEADESPLKAAFWSRYQAALDLAEYHYQATPEPLGCGMGDPTVQRQDSTETGIGQDGTRARGLAPVVPIRTEPTTLEQRAAAFLTDYPKLYTEWRHGARYRVKEAQKFPDVLQLVADYPDDAWLRALVQLWLRTDLQFAEGSDRGIGTFLARVSWCDDRLRQCGFNPSKPPTDVDIGLAAHVGGAGKGSAPSKQATVDEFKRQFLAKGES